MMPTPAHPFPGAPRYRAAGRLGRCPTAARASPGRMRTPGGSSPATRQNSRQPAPAAHPFFPSQCDQGEADELCNMP